MTEIGKRDKRTPNNKEICGKVCGIYASDGSMKIYHNRLDRPKIK